MRRLSLVACLALAACSPTLADEVPKKVAFLVGVMNYEKNLDPLRYTENDVVELGKVLTDHGYDVVVLCDSRGPKTRPCSRRGRTSSPSSKRSAR